MVWMMNRLSEVYSENAILKGGMVLRLLDSPRYTNDLDYIFIPFNSKKEILPMIEKVVSELEGAKIKSQFHSTSLRVQIEYQKIKIQIEANASQECKVEPLSTSSLAKANNQLPRIIRVMSLDWALAHKIAAWNERELMRDIYDIYFLHSVLKTLPDLEVLKKRLEKVNRRNQMKKSQIKKMSLKELKEKIENYANEITQKEITDGLQDILGPQERVGLDKKIKMSLASLKDYLDGKA